MTTEPPRRRLDRAAFDRQGWPHRRPPSDPRLVSLVIGLSWVAFAQTFLTRPKTTVAAQAFDSAAAVSVAVLVVVASILLLYAAYCRDQYTSWGVEATACSLFAAQCAIQFYALVTVNPEWYATSTLAWSAFFGVGNILRVGAIVVTVKRAR